MPLRASILRCEANEGQIPAAATPSAASAAADNMDLIRRRRVT